MLKGMQLATHYETLIPDLVTLYQCQIDLYQRLNEISAKFLAGPKPGVDYSSLAAEVPEIRAELEQLQNVVFAASALVFMTLVDPKPDSQDQVSHLLITKAEKSDLEGKTVRGLGHDKPWFTTLSRVNRLRNSSLGIARAPTLSPSPL